MTDNEKRKQDCVGWVFSLECIRDCCGEYREGGRLVMTSSEMGLVIRGSQHQAEVV